MKHCHCISSALHYGYRIPEMPGAVVIIRILRDQSEASGVQGTVINNLRAKLEEVEQQLQKEKLDHQNVKVKYFSYDWSLFFLTCI